jgi:neutral ceramidase
MPMKKLPGIVLGLLLIGTTSLCHASEPRVGIAKLDITPPSGCSLAGYYHERRADGVLDPLFSKAIVLEQDGERAVFVVLDLISMKRSVTDKAREEIERSTGIKGDHVMVSATHAHTGPLLADSDQLSQDAGGLSQIALQYTDRLPGLIADSVRVANEGLQPVRLNAAKGHCENLAFNRRYLMRDGSVGWNPGTLNTNILVPAGPIDPEVGVLYIEKADAKSPVQSMATYVDFAMHPDTTGGSKISADWPGALSRILEGYHGTQHLTMVANGACGNINHADFSWSWPNSGYTEQNRIAAILGSAVFLAYKDLKPLKGGALHAKSTLVELPLSPTTPQQLEEARQTLAEGRTNLNVNFMKLVKAYRAVEVVGRKGKPLQVEVQAISLGEEVAWIGLPGEVFVELGLALKKWSPFPHTFVVELANENIGYIPDRHSYAEGNYEPESARCAAGSGEKLVKSAIELLEELKRRP